MSRINRLTKLSLVTSTPTSAPPHANRDTTSAATIPEGWFCEEMGYVGETAAGARALTLARPPRID